MKHVTQNLIIYIYIYENSEELRRPIIQTINEDEKVGKDKNSCVL